ncbi:hypothetical protein [Streptomyces sp. NPDC002855]|uniref:hypothetical protein n=1 Tax=Streptomyces sp. NPDC002855 TaxID=3154437 RepID=UPI00331F3FEC
MTSAELQRRLRGRRETQKLNRVRLAAAEIITTRTLTHAEVPAAALETVRGFWNTTTEPTATRGISQEGLDPWAEELLTHQGFNTKAYLLTDLDLAPWIEFRIPPTPWFATIRRAQDASWVFLRHDFGAVAAVSEQEHNFEFFAAQLP